MIKYAKLEDKEKGLVTVGLGTDTEFYKSQGFEELNVEQAWDGNWYLVDKVPAKPVAYDLEQELAKKERSYNMPRVIREGILGNPSMYSEFNVNRAKDLEDLAKKVRDLKEGK